MPQEQTTPEPETQVDVAAASAEISSELFGQGTEEETAAPSEGAEQEAPAVPSADSEESTPPQPAEEEEAPKEEETTSEEVQELGAPETWTKEAIAEWATVPERAKQEILKREEDMFRGLEEYRGRAEIGDRYNKIIEPYAPILEAEHIDPDQLLSSFAANHYLLSRGTPQQKTELTASLIHGYGIDINALLDYLGSVPAPTETETALQQRVGQLENQLNSQNKQSQEQMDRQVDAEIQAFAADPAHPYFKEVAADMSTLFESKAATTLQEAYDKAVWMNPATRQKEMDRQTAERQSQADAAEKARLDKIAKSTAADVTTNQTDRDGTVPLGSMDDTLNETLAEINSRS